MDFRAVMCWFMNDGNMPILFPSNILITLPKAIPPSSVVVVHGFLHNNVYYNTDSATVINNSILKFNAVPVEFSPGGTSAFYTYTGQGIKTADSIVVTGALMQGTTLVDSVTVVFILG
jgi:hypothetical protein